MAHVHFESELEAARIEQVRAALASLAPVTVGPNPPVETTVLVSGRPPDGVLDRQPLKAVIVPWAGIPPQLLQDIRERPHLKLYNLHHNNLATAEMAIALLLDCARQTTLSDRELRKGIWRGRQGQGHGYLLAGKTAMVYGYGAIGKQIGRVLEALGMKVIGVRRDPSGDWKKHLSECEVLIVAAPLTEETKGAIGRAELSALKEPRLVVNIARGPIIDEQALFEACERGAIVGAGIDVWYRYPKDETPTFPSQFAFQDLDNVVMSPHCGGSGDTTEDLRTRDLIELIAAILSHQNPASVNLETGY